MAEQISETIAGEKDIVNTLRSLVDSRVTCKMEVPRNDQSWITLLLEVRNVRNTYHLLVDSVAGFETVLSGSHDKEVSIEFKDQVGVPCRFNAKIIACNPKAIVASLPEAIYRIQRRKHFRIEALLGTEISFLDGTSTERRKTGVKNYSGGGVAFYLENDRRTPNVGDSLTDLHLCIPEGGKQVRFCIPKAAVRRVDPESSLTGKAVCAVEFTEIPGETRNHISSHVFRQQRVIMHRFGNRLRK
jgi:c-di-GMP-binding flagellar brake protein YcgR